MRPMLAGQYVPEKIRNQLPIFGQPKLDGIRMFIRGGVAYTRSLKPVRSELVQSLVQRNAEILEGLDGEIIAGDPTSKDCYRRTSSSVMSYAKQDDITFHVFDHWSYGGKFLRRICHLKSLALPSWCHLVDTRLLKTMDEISVYEAELLSEGYEGVILRNPECEYKFGRGTPTNGELIKLKQFLDAEARVTGFVEFMHNSNEATTNALGYMERTSHQENLIPMGTLGALMAEGQFEDGTKYKVRIGTGFDNVTRQEVWGNQMNYLGKMVKFKYFPTGMKEAPRFPVFLGFRDADDLSSAEPSGAPVQEDLFG